MGPKPQKKNAESAGETKTQQKNPVSGMQAGAEMDALGQLADGLTLQKAMANPRQLSPQAVPDLQRSLGNQYVQMMLTGAARRQSPSHVAEGVQTQMTEDYAEQSSPQAQEPPGGGDPPQVTQRAPDAGGELPDSMGDAINQGISAGGKSLPQDAQAKMKQDLGMANPERIQVHHDATADALSKSLGAKAFTTGSHIFFRQGNYDPGTARGQSLLYHEGVHTMQQGGTQGKTAQTKLVVNPPDDKYEQEADEVAARATTAADPGGLRSPPPGTAPNVPRPAPEEFAEEEISPTDLSVSAVPPLQTAEDEDEEQKKEEAKEKGGEVATELEEKKEKTKKGAKGEAKEKGKEQAEAKKKEAKKVPKPEKEKPPEKIDPGLPLPEPAVDSTEVKYEPEEEPEEPEMDDPPLPTWEELAAGTVQMSAEDVSQELGIRQALTGEERSIEIGEEAEGAAVAEDEEWAEVDRGALIGDALGEGALEGFTEGMSSFIADQAVEAATSKIPYFDGFVNMAKLAHDPSAWAAENVMSIGTGAVDMVKGFAAIGDEDTAWGFAAATLEALVGVIDLVNSIIGLINTIFTIILAIAKVMVAAGNAMIALAPTVPFCILCWMAPVGSVMVTVGSTIISFLEPINDFLSLIANALNFIKFLLNPFIMLFRILDILETKADPEKLKEKQEKLKSATKSFTQYATQQAANRTKDAAVDGINRNLDKRALKKAENEAEHPTPRKPGESEDEFDARAAKAKDDFDAMKKDYEAAYGKGAYEADKQRGALGVAGAQAKKVFTAHPLKKETWKKKLKGVKEAPGKARQTAKETWEGTKAARTKPPGGITPGTGITTYAGALYRTRTSKKARKKAQEAEDDYRARKRTSGEAEDDYTAKKRASGEAENDYEAKKKALKDAQADRARKLDAYLEEIESGSTQSRKKALDEYGEAIRKRRKAKQEADEADRKRKEKKKEVDEADRKRKEAKKEADEAKAERNRRRQEKEIEEAAAGRMAEAISKDWKWRKKQWGTAWEMGVKKGWLEATGWTGGGGRLRRVGHWLRGGAFGGGEGGQRHGPGVTGPAVDFFEDVFGFDFGREAMRKAFGGKEKTDALDLLKKEWEAIQDGDAEKAAELTPQVDDAVAKLDLESEKEKLADMRAVLTKMSWSLSEASEDDARENITWQERLVSRIEQVQQARGTSAVEEWAKDYGWVKPVYLELEATGLDGHNRKDPNAPVFIVKTGRKGGVIGELLAYTGLEIDASGEIKVTEASQTVEIVMYKGMRLSVDPQPVELLRADQATLRYEPNESQTNIETEKATDSEQGRVTVTVPYEEISTVQAKLQRAPDETEMDGLPGATAAPATHRPGIELQPTLDQAALASRSGQAEGLVQRAPDDEIEEQTGEETEEAPLTAATEFAGDEAEMEEETEMIELEEGEEEEEGEGGPAVLIFMEHQARLLEMLPPPPEGAIERIQGAALAYDEVDAEEYGLRLQKQQIGGLQQHSVGQLAEVKGTRQLTAAHQKGVAQQQADAETKLEAQNQMEQASSAKEGNAQKTADESGGIMEAFGGIFNKILEGFGLPIGGGSADAGGAKEGIKEQANQTDAMAQGAQDATKLSQKRAAETEKVKAEAAGVQNELGGFDDQMAEEEAGVREGMGELGEAQSINQEQLTSAQEGKEQLREQHTSALIEAETWALEHRLIREEILGELEQAMEDVPEEEAEVAF